MRFTLFWQTFPKNIPTHLRSAPILVIARPNSPEYHAFLPPPLLGAIFVDKTIFTDSLHLTGDGHYCEMSQRWPECAFGLHNDMRLPAHRRSDVPSYQMNLALH